MARSNLRKMDPVHAMLFGNLLWGMALGVVFAAGVYGLDLGHIRTLVGKSPDGLLAMALLTAGSVITFASAVMGGAVMLLPRGDEDKPQGGNRILMRALVPVRVRVPAAAQGVARRPRF